MKINLHRGDLPAGVSFGDSVAIDTETMGLEPSRDRLCLVQLSAGDGTAHLVQLAAGSYDAPNLKALLTDPKVLKLFHFARFDIAMLRRYLGVITAPAYCTKVASKLARTFTDRHGLRDLCRELLGVEISKQQQTSDWGAVELASEQLAYAASDGEARCHAGARGPSIPGPSLLCFPPGARGARPRGLPGPRPLRALSQI